MKKLKRLLPLCLAVIMLCSILLPVMAGNATYKKEGLIHNMALGYEDWTLPRLYDGAGLLSDSDAEDICERLDEISNRQSFDIVICTVERLPEGYSSIVNFADDYFDYNDFGFGTMDRNGCLLVLDMSQRDWYICTTGYGKTVFTDWGIQYIGDKLKENGLSDGKYYEAFLEFIKQCDDFIEQAEDGKPYDVNNQPVDKKAALKKSILIGIISGLVLALIVVGVMYASMKSVAKKTEAGHYVVPDSLHIDYASDVFLYSKVTKERKESDSGSGGGSSTHTGSSGVSHGGGGGKF